MGKVEYQPEKCLECGQTKTYLVPVDRGAAIIVIAIAAAIRRKRINMVHPGKEMEIPRRQWSFSRAASEGLLPSNFIDNFSRVRFHGLIARVRSEVGNWCLTTKGSLFLHGERIARYAIRSKSEKHTTGYYMPETETITITEALRQPEIWAVPDFRIVEGRILLDLPGQKALTGTLV